MSEELEVNKVEDLTNEALCQAYEALIAPFPPEAYSVDSSRGFDLTSLKAQYVVERLNEVFGLGNWNLEGSYEHVENGVLFHGSLIAAVNLRKLEVQNVGYAALKKNMGDVYKGARTDCLSKCASWLGLGNDIYKGKVNPDDIKKASKSKPNKTKTTKTETKTASSRFR